MDAIEHVDIPAFPTWLVPTIANASSRTAVADDSNIPEHYRNKTLASLAGIMRRPGMSHAAIRAALLEENALRCVPPLAVSEVEEIARSIARYEPGDPLVIVDDGSSENVPSESKLRFRTAAEIALDTPEVPPFVIHGYVARGCVTELVGKAKAAGKTTWLMHGIRRVLDGEPFIGDATLSGPVIYLTEERPQTFRETLRRADLLERQDLTVLYWHDTIGVGWPDVVRAAVEEATTRGAHMLVVDTVSQFAGLRGDAENNAGDALSALQPLQEAASKGLAVVAIRHERKGGGEVGESGRGSSAFAGAVDIVVALRRADGQSRPGIRVLHALSRFDETPDELVIELTPDGYVSLGSSAAVAVKDATEAIIRTAPQSEETAIPEKELLEAVPELIKRTTARAALGNLRDAGRVHRVGAGKRGDPYRYWIRGESEVADYGGSAD